MLKDFALLLLHLLLFFVNIDGQLRVIHSLKDYEVTSPYVKCMAYIDFQLVIRDKNWKLLETFKHLVPGVIIKSNIIITNHVPNVQTLFNTTKYIRRDVLYISANCAFAGLSQIKISENAKQKVDLLTSFNINYFFYDNIYYLGALKEDFDSIQMALAITKRDFLLDEKFIIPIPLADESVDYMQKHYTAPCHLLGWGQELHENSKLFEIAVNLLPQNACIELLPLYYNIDCFAVINGSIDICPDLRGGEPVICQNSLVGIVRTVDCMTVNGALPFTDVFSHKKWLGDNFLMYSYKNMIDIPRIEAASKMEFLYIKLYMAIAITITIKQIIIVQYCFNC